MSPFEKDHDDQTPFLFEKDHEDMVKLSPRVLDSVTKAQLTVLIISVFGGIIICGGIGFALGLQADRDSESLGWSTIGLKEQQYVFESNQSFLQRSVNLSETSDPTWLSLYPSHNGFFYFPDAKPVKSNLAGFHQMHCVDTLRRGYYEVYDSRQAMIEGKNTSEVYESIPIYHVLHCIEYLRNSIMCHADATMEFTADATQGIGGFGFVHSCRNWRQMVQWVNDRNLRYDELREAAMAND